MSISLPEIVKNVLDKLVDSGHEVYLVGGAVRDHLMDKEIYDWDFTTDATPEEMLEIFKAEEAFHKGFGTVGIPVEDERPLEITTFREEFGYSDKRRPDEVMWGKSIEDDLKRRDFTINAMAVNLGNDKQEIIDLYGGKKDLKSKKIRAVGDAVERFDEDALRMMRAVRIASELGFDIDHETFEAIKMHSSLINKIATERVRDELFKIIASKYPYDGVVMLRNSGLMLEILPELEKTFGVEQKSPGRHHVHDVWIHSILSLKNCKSDDVITRFATLIHDIGKPQTYKKLKNGTITFYNHEVVGSRIAKNIAIRLKFSKKQTDKLFKLVRWHQFTVDERQTDKAIRRFLRKVTPEYLDDMLTLRVGDRLGGGARETSWRLEEFKSRLVEVQKQPFTVHDLKIKGDDVMRELDMKPGPEVGEILNKIYKKVVDKKIENEKEELFVELRKYK